MGLDISAYSNIKFVRPLDDDADPDWRKGEFEVWHNDGFPGRADDVPEGVYTGEVADAGFSGPYSYYNRWRAELCRTVHGVEPQVIWDDIYAGGSDWAGADFVELINFSDCEGALGTAVCKRILAAFENHPLAGGEHRAEMRAVFAAGANNGVVLFN